MTRLLQFQKNQSGQKLWPLLGLLLFVLLALSADTAAACSLRPILSSRDSCTYFEFTGDNKVDSASTFHLYGCLKYSWNFGDGTMATGRTPSHTYTSTGTYTVCMKITDTCRGCDTTICKTITTICPAPCRLPTGWKQEDTCASFFFNGFQSVDWKGRTYTDPCLKYSWNFGDGKTATGKTAWHKYTRNGTFNVCMKVEDTCRGCDTTICKTITIACIAPCSGLPTGWISRDSCTSYTFEGDRPVDSIGLPYTNPCLKYSWNFGDGTSASGRFAAHTYSNGTYLVSMRVQDTCKGCDSTFYRTIYVSCRTSCALPVTWKQTDSCGDYNFAGATDTMATPGCMIYAWDFGDSTYAYGPTTSHSYKRTGTYRVCMGVRDTCRGCDTIVCKTITVTCVTPPSSIKGIGKDATHTSVYPNPASGSFMLNSGGKTSYKIFDAYGKMVSSGSFSDHIELSTNSFNNGIYLIQTNSDNQQEIQKLMIIK